MVYSALKMCTLKSLSLSKKHDVITKLSITTEMEVDISQNIDMCRHTYIMQSQSKCIVTKRQVVNEARHPWKCCPQLTVITGDVSWPSGFYEFYRKRSSSPGSFINIHQILIVGSTYLIRDFSISTKTSQRNISIKKL